MTAFRSATTPSGQFASGALSTRPAPQGYDIRVQVQSEFLPEQSSPESSRFVFAYHITIENHGHYAAQLLTRHWVVTDGDQRVQEVRGDGVVGAQPYLAPGERYHYTSGTILETPVGAMYGSYGMTGESGEPFDARIPAFTLAVPNLLN